MADKIKRIDIRVSESELLQIDKQAEKANMNRSKFLIEAALGKQIIIIGNGKEIVWHLSKIGTNINDLRKLAYQGRINNIYFDKFAGEMKAIWQLLSSSINPTEAMRE